ncbi:MFS transporter [Kitasatospora sp. NPDC059722]|uniref:MFS transporter n=1 Tax=unclassified Kitasatospora TaxID=2633591 RepID=UPI00365DE330
MTAISPAGRRALWAYRFFMGTSNAQFTRGVFIVYLVAHGRSLFEMGLLEACFHASRLIADVPLGSLADRLGRRAVITAGLLAGAAGAALMLATPLWLLVVSFALQGLGWAGQRGADSALLYELLDDLGRSELFARETGRAMGLGFAVLALTTFVGGAMYEHLYWLPFVAHALAVAGASWFVWRVPESPQPVDRRATMAGTIVAGWRVLRRRRHLLNALLFGALVNAGVTAVSIFSQDFFAGLGLKPTAVSLVIGFITLVAAGVSAVAHRLTALGMTRAMLIAAVLFASGLLGMYSARPWFAIVGYYCVFLTIDLIYPLLSQVVNDATDNAVRSTVLSFGGLIGGLATTVSFVVTGSVVASFGYTWVFAGLLVLSLPLFGILLRSRPGAGPAVGARTPVTSGDQL